MNRFFLGIGSLGIGSLGIMVHNSRIWGTTQPYTRTRAPEAPTREHATIPFPFRDIRDSVA